MIPPPPTLSEPRPSESGTLPQPSPLDAAGRNGERAAVHWPVEAHYLAGLAQWALQEPSAAADVLATPAQTLNSASAPLAQALLGALLFQQGKWDEAAKWWQRLEPERRNAWKIGETLAGAMFLSALDDFHAGRFEEAADRMRQAGRLGCRDRRLGPLLVASLFKAGQAIVFGPHSGVESGE